MVGALQVPVKIRIVVVVVVVLIETRGLIRTTTITTTTTSEIPRGSDFATVSYRPIVRDAHFPASSESPSKRSPSHTVGIARTHRRTL